MNELAEKTISVGIVDDHPFVQKGLGAIVDSDPDLCVKWASLSVEEALDLLEHNPVDVLVVDMKIGSTPGGVRILESLRCRENANTKVIVLSAYASRRIVRETARLGAAGYFSKTQDVSEVTGAIKRLLEGEATGFMGPYSNWARPYPYLELSKREIDVLSEMAKGRSNPEVAALLGLKIGTVKTHLESIYRKLGVKSRTEALRVALAEGYFYLDEII